MAVKIGHARVSENGTTEGKKGDYTKKEVCVGEWYAKDWDYIAIHPDPEVREKHAKAVEDACANDCIGYGQSDRNTLNKVAKAVKYDISKITENCNCDCSSLQNVCAIVSGAKGVTYASNGWVTRTMRSKLKAAGYIIIEDEAYLKYSTYAVRGAIYVAEGSHTLTTLSNGAKYKKTLEKAGLIKTNTTLVATEAAKSKEVSLSGKYVVTAESLHIRNGAGTNRKSMGTIPKGTVVNNYGYYTKNSTGTIWLYIQTEYNNVIYTGFCSSNYLAKK